MKRLQRFINDFSLFMKQFYRIVWSIEKKTQSKKSSVVSTNKGKPKLLSNCTKCDSKKLIFIKEQGGSGLMSNVELKTPLSKNPLSGNILF